MNFEDWLNENCNPKDFSETANQANDFLHTSDVITYVNKYLDALKNMESSSRIIGRLSSDDLKRECNEMLYQIRGNKIEPHEQCEEQGHPDWQIAMSYFRKLNDR